MITFDYVLRNGMKQRLQIARGLINNPDYIFMDEPTLGLDTVISKELASLGLKKKTIYLDIQSGKGEVDEKILRACKLADNPSMVEYDGAEGAVIITSLEDLKTVVSKVCMEILFRKGLRNIGAYISFTSK